jgi:chromosome segregation ATPase
MSRLSRQIFEAFLSLVILALFFFGLNSLLFLGQKMSNHGSQVQLERMNQELKVELSRIQDMETKLKSKSYSLDRSVSRIKALKQSIQSIEQNNYQGVPTNVYKDYSRLIEEHNALISMYKTSRSEYDVLYADYNKTVEYYNNQVREANTLAKQVGTTVLIVPGVRARTH